MSREHLEAFVKEALLERLVRLAATDVPGTPRVVMKHRSPEELAALQNSVTGAFQKWEEPAKKAVHGVIDKIPHAGAQRVLKGGANMMIENPEMIPMQAIPLPGVSLGYLGAKKGLEKGLDRLAPIHKTAFSTNAFSGPMNPVIETGASSIPPFKMPGLRTPVQKTAKEKRTFQEVLAENPAWATAVPAALGFLQGSYIAKDEGIGPLGQKMLGALVALGYGSSGYRLSQHFKKKLQEREKTAATLSEFAIAGGALGGLGGGYAGYQKGKETDQRWSGAARGALGGSIGTLAGVTGGAMLPSEANYAVIPSAALGGLAGYKAMTAGMGKKNGEEKVAFKLQGHDTHQGLEIAIENKPGSVRKGTTEDGKKWRTVMKNAYGYIKGSHGADGEEVDCYLGPHAEATHAHVVHQHKPNGKGYDEDKVMLGFGSREEARKAYLAHYDDPKFLGPMKSVPMDRFKKLIEAGKKLVKISASSPTRGGFLLASDIPAFKTPSLSAPVEKTSDMLPDYISTNDGVGFKRSKYAREKCHVGEKVADVSPTSPLGDGGGNPHRAESSIPPFRGSSLRTPLTKVSEFSDISAYNGGPSSAGRGPVNEAGFRQAGDLPSIPVNSLRAPLIKRGALGLGTNPMGAMSAAKKVGTTPSLAGGKGPSIADITKPKGKGFGGPLPGANKGSIGTFSAPDGAM